MPRSRTTTRVILGATLVAGALAAPSVATGALGAQVAPQPAAASLRGRVTDATTRQPLAGAEVRVMSPDGALLALARSDDAGAYHVERLAPGRWRVAVRRLGYVARTLDVADAAVLDVALDAAALRLDQVVVTAARREQRLKDVTVATELLGRDEIARSGATDLASVLSEQVGIQLDGGTPAGAGVMLQGLGSQRVLVLLDGQPVAGRVGGHFDVSRIPTSVIERVEVVKGPQSTLYGSEAMGGVINIVTRTPLATALGGAAMLTAGDQGRRDASARLDWGRGPLAIAVDAGRRAIEVAPGVPSLSGTLAERVDGALKARLTMDSTRWLEASVLALDERQRWREATLYAFGDNRQVSARASGHWQRGAHRLTPSVSGSAYEHVFRRSVASKPITGDTGQVQVQRLVEADLLCNRALGASTLDVGVEARHEDAESPRVPGGTRARRQVEPFAQLELVRGAVSIVPGARLTWNDQWGTRVTPRLALRWSARDAVTVRVAAGSGFRAPSFNELYLNFPNLANGYGVYGNEALRPESSRNLSGGVELASGRWYARSHAYWNDLRDFIQTQPFTNPEVPVAYQYANIERGRTSGVDVEGGLTVRGARVEAGYGWLRAKDLMAGRLMLGRAPHTARASATLPLPLGVRASVTALMTGATPMSADTAGALSWRDRFTRADVRLARAVPGGLELVLGADNLFDTQPDRWAGFAGRHLYSSLSWNFNRAAGPAR